MPLFIKIYRMNRKYPWRLRLLYLSLLMIFGITLSLIAMANLPNNAIAIKSKTRTFFQSFSPQGWAFFTRDAREEIIEVYSRDQKGNWEKVNVPGSSFRYAFGLNRKGRAFGVEINRLLSQFKEQDWTKSRQAEWYSINDSLIKHEVNNPCPLPICKGNLLVKISPPVPWAWLGSKKKVIMPYKILRLDVNENIIKH
jgi:antimicrobial peptide system SdpA family protein